VKSLSIFSKNQKHNLSSTKPQFQFSYSIIPTNFANLSNTNQNERLSKFFDILRVIQSKIKITMSRSMMPIIVEEQTITMPVMQVHLESNEPLSDLLERLKLEYVENSRSPKYKIIKEYLNKLEISIIDNNTPDQSDKIVEYTVDSFFAKCFTLYSVPASLPYAWINHIFSICSEVQMWIRPIPHDESVTKMTKSEKVISLFYIFIIGFMIIFK